MITHNYYIPFRSITGNPYLVTLVRFEDDGLDTYSLQKHTLTAGAEPLTMDEDPTDNLFTPVRSITGILSVIDTDGSLMETLAPDNNTHIPFAIYAGTSAGNDTLLYNGFLSAESYNRQYTARPQASDFNLNTMLEAAASLYLPNNYIGRYSIRQILCKCLEIFRIAYRNATYCNPDDIQQHIQEQFTRLAPFAGIAYPVSDSNALGIIIDTSVLFQTEEITNEYSTTYETRSLSIRDILERICTFFGWTAREAARTLYLQRANEQCAYIYESYADFFYGTPSSHPAATDITELPDTSRYQITGTSPIVNQLPTAQFLTRSRLSTLIYRGTDHQHTIHQGARAVSLSANLLTRSIAMQLPECPNGNFKDTILRDMRAIQFGYGEPHWWILLNVHNSTTPYSNVALTYSQLLLDVHHHQAADFDYSDWSYQYFIPHDRQASDLDTVTANTIPAAGWNSPSVIIRGFSDAADKPFYTGALFAYYAIGYGKDSSEALQNLTRHAKPCLYLSLAPKSKKYKEGTYFDGGIDPEPAITITHTDTFAVPSSGYVRLDADLLAIRNTAEMGRLQYPKMYMLFRLQIGNQYYNGTGWQTTPCFFEVQLQDGGSILPNYNSSIHTDIDQTTGYLIPVSDSMTGEISLTIADMYIPENKWTGDMAGSFLSELCIKSLSLDYIPVKDTSLSDRSANKYYRLLGTAFPDTVHTTTDLATNLNNQPSPSLIRRYTLDEQQEHITGSELATGLNYPHVIAVPQVDPATGETRITYQIERMPERPETNLIERMADFYRQTRRILQLETLHNPAGTPLPLLSYTGYDNHTYLPVAASTNFRTEQTTLTLLEVPPFGITARPTT